ncbi:MAG: type II toxin-antitoxin system RelE/ParE family toxin [Bacteroidota bacterium]
MSQVIWTHRALKDLEDIYDYISLDSEIADLNVVNEILDCEIHFSGETFLDGPKLGIENYHYFIKNNYRIVYRRDDFIILIITVFDTRRNPDKLFL